MGKVSLFAVATLALASSVAAQQVGTLTAETHPKITINTCTKSGGCTSASRPIVLDSNWRWTHITSGSTNCYDGNTWDTSICTSNAVCGEKCAIEGADYSGTYGITASGSQVAIKFVQKHTYGTNIGARVYLMENDTKYQLLKLLNKEFTFDVDVSTVGCGLNGALYLSEMDADGGMSRFSSNKAGAKYGTGYCDAQCPHDIKWINGEGNVEGWNPSSVDDNAGSGRYGTCCHEMDIWEANGISNAYTPHPCDTISQQRCDGVECGDNDKDERYLGLCDKDGCDINPYRMGNRDFYGPGKVVDTTKPFTVVTQFLTSDGTDNGDLVEIRRLYVQGGKVIPNPPSNFANWGPYDSITDQMCVDQKAFFGDNDHHVRLGGLKKQGEALKRGMTLVMSIWGDFAARMLWLDSQYPLDKDPEQPGIARGPCSQDSGNPDDLVRDVPNSTVKFSNIKWGEIGSTYTGTVSTTTTARTTTTTARTSSTTTRTTTTTTRTTTGGGSGTCVPTTTTVTVQGGATTVYSTVTVTAGQSTTRPTTTTTTTRTTTGGGSTNCAAKYAQCGGTGYSGPTCCASGSTCTTSNQWYSQCL